MKGRSSAFSPPWPAWIDPFLSAAAAVAIHVRFLAADPFFFGDDFGCLADVDNLTRGTTSFFSLPPWGVWRLGHRAFLWLEYSLFGLRPWPYHATNVLVHAVASALVCVLARKLGGGRGRSVVAAVVFAAWAFPSLTVRYPAVSAPILASLTVLGAVVFWLQGRPWPAAVLTVAGAMVYEQALAAPAVMLALCALGRRHLARQAIPAVAAAALFVIVNLWTLRGTTKVFAYNAGGTGAVRQLLLAPALVFDLPTAWRQGWGLALVPLALVGLALAWKPARGSLPGLALAWSATLPLAGRALDWPAWYLYLPSAGVAVALALAAPASRAWTMALAGLALVNVWQQRSHERAFIDYTARYREVTLQTPVHPALPAVVLVNVHSGLAWTAWQFGGSVRRFELWDAPRAGAACFPGSTLAEAAAEAARAFPQGRRRLTFPDDMPEALRSVRAPARHHVFDWPPDGRVPH